MELSRLDCSLSVSCSLTCQPAGSGFDEQRLANACHSLGHSLCELRNTIASQQSRIQLYNDTGEEGVLAEAKKEVDAPVKHHLPVWGLLFHNARTWAHNTELLEARVDRVRGLIQQLNPIEGMPRMPPVANAPNMSDEALELEPLLIQQHSDAPNMELEMLAEEA